MLGLIKPYKGMIFLLVLLALGSNGLTLVLPRLISHAIDSFIVEKLDYSSVIGQFLMLAFGILALTLIQNVIQVYASEKVARDLR
ncbi:MAG: transporter ATP-binding protein, partial [Verrucomicrobiales bacterium]|nr:transporter ATP-binding protein [Verrucomicrobiales bacterium]